jgi:hypothetical protein
MIFEIRCSCGIIHKVNPAALLGKMTSDKKKVSSAKNGCAPVKPGSKPRGRQKKINEKSLNTNQTLNIIEKHS